MQPRQQVWTSSGWNEAKIWLSSTEWADRRCLMAQDNYPKLGVTQVELSPFYLLEARKNMDYWRRMRGGSNPEDTVASKDRFLQAPGENVPVPDGSYDSVSMHRLKSA